MRSLTGSLRLLSILENVNESRRLFLFASSPLSNRYLVLLALGLLMVSYLGNFVISPGIIGLAVKWGSQLSLWKALSSWRTKTTAKVNPSSEQHTCTWDLFKLLATFYTLLMLSKKRNSHNLRQEIREKILGRFRLVPDDNSRDRKESFNLLLIAIIILTNTNGGKSELKRPRDRFKLVSEDTIKNVLQRNKI